MIFGHLLFYLNSSYVGVFIFPTAVSQYVQWELWTMYSVQCTEIGDPRRVFSVPAAWAQFPSVSPSIIMDGWGSVQFPSYSVPFTLYTELYNERCTVNRVQCTALIVQCSYCTLHCTVYSVQFPRYSILPTLLQATNYQKIYWPVTGIPMGGRVCTLLFTV